MSHQRSRTSHFGWWLLRRLTGAFDHGRGVSSPSRPRRWLVRSLAGSHFRRLVSETAPPPRDPLLPEASAHPRGPRSEGQLVSTELHSPRSDGVFARFAGHEQVVFCHDEPTGLSAIIAIYSTAL